jgi:hypothetical protein
MQVRLLPAAVNGAPAMTETLDAPAGYVMSHCSPATGVALVSERFSETLPPETTAAEERARD